MKYKGKLMENMKYAIILPRIPTSFSQTDPVKYIVESDSAELNTDATRN